MKQKLYSLTASLFTKLALVAALVVGWGNAAMADTVIFGGTVASGWEYKNSSGTNVTPTNDTSNSVYTLYDGGGYGTPKTYTSTNSIIISAGEKIEITARRSSTNTNSLPSLKVKYSADGGTTWTEAVEFTETSITSTTYTDVIVDNIVGTYKIQFELKNVYISSIVLKEAPTTPVLSITHPDGGDAFGEQAGDTYKTYTVTNSGVGSMNVTISSNNDTEFSVSPSNIEGIGAGESETFTIAFHHSMERLGERSATITVTPDYEGGIPVEISATATAIDPNAADYVFDEENASTWSTSYSGTKKVLLKYTPKDGWNTFCVPFGPANIMNDIFGSGWEAYTLGSYTNETLTFNKANTFSASTPYLVYVETAAVHPSGVLFETTSIYGTTPGHPNVNGVTFQGTYAPKAAGTLTNCYGVTQDGRLAKAGAGASMKGYRAYLTGLPTSGAVKMMVINSDAPTNVGLLQMAEGADKAVYNLSGQKVKNVTKGLYIINGKKVVVK